MNLKEFRTVRILVAFFVALTVSVAVSLDNGYLALAGVSIGMLFLFIVRKKVKQPLYDERIKSVSGEAARMTYAIVTIVLAFFSLMLMFGGRNADNIFLESLGITLSYTALLNIAVYAVMFKYYNSKYGADE
ncbi:MAG: DUF2178 domain-containing protein [Candidatus Gracilibacteria bacterium]|nr:DUF2178 domain-containing protein [Candidatus Gracilibacteria bacterium]